MSVTPYELTPMPARVFPPPPTVSALLCMYISVARVLLSLQAWNHPTQCHPFPQVGRTSGNVKTPNLPERVRKAEEPTGETTRPEGDGHETWADPPPIFKPEGLVPFSSNWIFFKTNKLLSDGFPCIGILACAIVMMSTLTEYAYRILPPYATLVHQSKGTKYPR